MSAQLPSKTDKNRKNLIIVLIFFAVLATGSCCALTLMTGGLFGYFSSVKKTYYPDCDATTSSDACQTCCKQHGHGGYGYGPFMQDGNHHCGCF